MFQTLTIAKKEFTDAVGNKVFLTFLVFLMILTVISIFVGSLDFQSKVSIYQKAYQQLVQNGQPVNSLAKPEFYPLQLLRGSIEYLEIIGAILAIVIGYLTIAKERGNNTLQLILSRPVSRVTFLIGKLLGNAFLLFLVTTTIFILIFIVTTQVGSVALKATELIRLTLSWGFSFIYLFIFFCISVSISLLIKSLPSALIVSFVLWLLFVLIVPQIGDTMDPDNQVPGGFFAQLHMSKPQQLIVLKQFTAYETIRNALEESSLTKHYERLVFAITGIKDTYNGKPLPFIFRDRLTDIIWLIVSAILFSTLPVNIFNKKKALWNEQ